MKKEERGIRMNQDAIDKVVNDESIPEEDRIYSANRKYWCKKTTKESADQLLKNIEQMKKDIKQRGIKQSVPLKDNIIEQIKSDAEEQGSKYVIPPKEDWHIKYARALPIKNNPSFRTDLHLIFDEKQGKYRMYTDDTKYGEQKEIIFSKENQDLIIKNLNKLREKWNDAHKDKVKRDIDGDFDDFNKEKF